MLRCLRRCGGWPQETVSPDKETGGNGCDCALLGFERVQQLMRSGQSANEVAAAAQRFARMRVIGCA
jgi:hypothetical protein